MDRLRKSFGGASDEESGLTTVDVADSACGNLSWGTRLRGFGICLVVGIILSVVGSICVFFAQYNLFAALFTIGNIMSLCSTCFLMGPINQIKKMFALTRLIATCVVFITMILTLLSGLLWHNGVLSLLFCIIQYLALIWYSISYIPFARDAVTKCFGACLA